MTDTRISYSKPALTTSELLKHLEERGLTIQNHSDALFALNHIGYYRLLIYMRPLQKDPGKRFSSGTCFEGILDLYNFDRELRLLCLDAIERIEVGLRTAIVNELAIAHGPHFYLEATHFECFDRYLDFLNKASSAHYLAISHYKERYKEPPLAPIWAICEAITFGTLSHLYSSLTIRNRKLVARQFAYAEGILVSWFRTINDLRNICAHHNRLWDAGMEVNKPMSASALSGELTPSLQQTFYARAIVLIAILQKMDRTSREALNKFRSCDVLKGLGFQPRHGRTIKGFGFSRRGNASH
jgi:abortive infection bacteriophage resistance protein